MNADVVCVPTRLLACRIESNAAAAGQPAECAQEVTLAAADLDDIAGDVADKQRQVIAHMSQMRLECLRMRLIVDVSGRIVDGSGLEGRVPHESATLAAAKVQGNVRRMSGIALRGVKPIQHGRLAARGEEFARFAAAAHRADCGR
jgi:hypothetical protein